MLRRNECLAAELASVCCTHSASQNKNIMRWVVSSLWFCSIIAWEHATSHKWEPRTDRCKWLNYPQAEKWKQLVNGFDQTWLLWQEVHQMWQDRLCSAWPCQLVIPSVAETGSHELTENWWTCSYCHTVAHAISLVGWPKHVKFLFFFCVHQIQLDLLTSSSDTRRHLVCSLIVRKCMQDTIPNISTNSSLFCEHVWGEILHTRIGYYSASEMIKIVLRLRLKSVIMY